MNRELKFRAWDKGTNTMIQTGFHVIGETTIFNLIEQYLYEHPVGEKTGLTRFGDVEITQFTGLKDKNGKEIYEGDILKEPTNTSYKFRGIGEVRYESDHGGFLVVGKWRINQHYESLTRDVAADCEVIGNVFENLELVELL